MGSPPNDDIPEGIPEEDREEFKRRREKIIDGLNENSGGSLEDFIRYQSLIHVWRACVLTGQPLLVESALKDGFTPDTPVDDEGYAPLVSIARATLRNVHEATGLANVARLLINHGAVLTLRDRCGLLPADHALFSPSTAIAREIVLATLRRNSERRSEKYFRPNYRAVFATIANSGAACASRSCLAANAEAVRNGIHHALIHGDLLLRDMPQRELEYWDRLKIPELEDLPGPTTALKQAYESIASREDAYARGDQHVTKDHIEKARDHARMLEAEYCRQFKPDYR